MLMNPIEEMIARKVYWGRKYFKNHAIRPMLLHWTGLEYALAEKASFWAEDILESATAGGGFF